METQAIQGDLDIILEKNYQYSDMAICSDSQAAELLCN